MEQKQETAIAKIINPELSTLTAILSLSAPASADLNTLVTQEIMYLENASLTNPDLLKCQAQSILFSIKNVLRNNLTLDPSAGLVYIKTRNVQVEGKWITVMEIQETANGLLSVYRQLGLILDFTNPLVKKDEKGKVIGVSWQILKPSYNGATRWETFEFDESDFERWRRAGHREKKRSFKEGKGMKVPDDDTMNYANQLYTSWKGGIDPEFARAKCIRHTLKKFGRNQNELKKLANIKAETIVNADMAVEDMRDDDAAFVQHEEISTEINNSESQDISTEPNGNFDFNSNDL